MNNGWITLHRKITKWEWYDDANTFRLFIHLLINANHTENSWRGNKVFRGQIIVGRKQLAEDLKLSERNIRTSLNKLKSTNEIAIKATNRFSLITLIKYSDYQDKQIEVTNQVTSQTPTSDQQVTTNNNDNNINNDNKKNTSRFAPPSLTELKNYIIEKQLSIDADSFINFYESKNWMIGKNKMKNWKSAARGWHSRNKTEVKNNGKSDNRPTTTSARFMERMRDDWHD